jgi:hypothetical protein
MSEFPLIKDLTIGINEYIARTGNKPELIVTNHATKCELLHEYNQMYLVRGLTGHPDISKFQGIDILVEDSDEKEPAMSKDNFMIINGQKVHLSHETVKEFERRFNIKKRIKPDASQAGFVVCGTGGIFEKRVYGVETEKYWRHGNWRATKAGAKKHARYQRAVQKVWEWREENGANVTGFWERQWYISYETAFNKLVVCGTVTTGKSSPYDVTRSFKSSETAHACLKACKKEFEIIWGLR